MARGKNVELPLLPGATTDDTDLASTLHAIDMDKTRTRLKRWETIKGWTAFNASGMSAGTARGIHAYSDLDGDPIIVAASESAVNAWKGGTRYTITPKWKDVWIGSATLGPTVSVAGSVITLYWYVFDPSTGVATLTAHDLKVGDSITISGGIRATGTADINGTFTITAVTTFTVTFDTGSGSGWTGERPVIVTVAFRSGVVTGAGDTIATRPRVYSIDNFGENAVFCGSDGTPIWTWQPETSSTNLVPEGNFTTSSPWIPSVNWSISGGIATHTGATPDDLSLDISAVLEGGKIYEMSFQVTACQANINFFSVKIDSVNIFPAWGTVFTTSTNAVRTYTFRFICPADPTNLVFTAGASAAGSSTFSIDNVSIALQVIATPINSAPQRNLALFVDGNRILHALGSYEADGDFNAMLDRWSDMDNYRIWIPAADNVSGEQSLGKGSRLVCGAQVGERDLILSDDAAYAASFTGTGYSFRLISQGCGAIGERSMAVYDGRAMWPSAKGFYGYDGASIGPMQCPEKDKFVGQLKQYQENKTFAWLNSEYGEVWIHYAHTSDGTEVSRYLIYSIAEEGNPWGFGTWNRTCMVRSKGNFQYPIGIDTTGAIWSHETGTGFSGSGIVLPFIETGYATAPGGDRWIGVRRYYPDIESQTGDILFTVTGKRDPQGSSNTQVIGPKTITSAQRKVDFLLRSRQLKFKWASSSSTTQWRLGVVGLEMIAERERR